MSENPEEAERAVSQLVLGSLILVGAMAWIIGLSATLRSGLLEKSLSTFAQMTDDLLHGPTAGEDPGERLIRQIVERLAERVEHL